MAALLGANNQPSSIAPPRGRPISTCDKHVAKIRAEMKLGVVASRIAQSLIRQFLPIADRKWLGLPSAVAMRVETRRRVLRCLVQGI